MEAVEAISLVAEWILWENLDYPTHGLLAERFDGGWRVSAPEDAESVFLIGDSGYIEEVSAAIPARQSQAEFTAGELAAKHTEGQHGPATD